MTLANRITLLRIFIAGAFFMFAAYNQTWSRILALVLFLIAAFTDWIDGFIARRTKTTSAFGIIMDPLADKLLVVAALVAFLTIRRLDIPPWVIYLIIAREFIIVTLRNLAALHGKVLGAERWGKCKMGFQSASIIAILAILLVQDGMEQSLSPAILEFIHPIPRYLCFLMLVLTWASGIIYLVQNRQLICKSWEKMEQ